MPATSTGPELADPSDAWSTIEPDYVGFLAGVSTLFRPPTLAESGAVNAAQRNLSIAVTVMVLLLILEIGNGWGPWARKPPMELPGADLASSPNQAAGAVVAA